MLSITQFTVEHLTHDCVTDEPNPRFSFALESDGYNISLSRATLRLNGWQTQTQSQIGIAYTGAPLLPFTEYTAQLQVQDNAGHTAAATLTFSTGRLNTPWAGCWITDPTYRFVAKGTSPQPMTFRKIFSLKKHIQKATIYATAMGIYHLTMNGAQIDDRYFAPGFTSYRHNLQYQTYDVTAFLAEENTLEALVAGGWAVGSFGIARKNRITAKRQALLLELRLTYPDGTIQVIGTDDSWEVTRDGALKMADLYDGEIYDGSFLPEERTWRPAAREQMRFRPNITADSGCPVRAHEHFTPVSCTKKDDCLIYDFGQNFAGVAQLRINGKAGQVITVKHAEVLNPDGTLNTAFLRSAKAELRYTCRDGQQFYSPRFTYMGFRYVSVSGIAAEQLQLSARALYSQMDRAGSFSCSNELLNQLQSNILWSAKSNFVDIPTDCPQRDERMGWTGDIAVFSTTACFNFHMDRFLEKWLKDLRSEQSPTGGIPNTIPNQGYRFPETMPLMAVDWWGDACVLVPWALYLSSGDPQILRSSYHSMKRYVKACAFWASLFSFGKHRYIWHTPAFVHFGDWVAPDLPTMQQWQKRSKWTATASLRNTSSLTAKIAGILGYEEDAAYFGQLSQRTADAFCAILTDGHGKLHTQFQTAYVHGLYLNIFPESVRQKAADNLLRLIQKNQYRIGTGFPGTPYILFALADNGHSDAAYQMLMNTRCPSWLYEVKLGATTIWERWDALDESGQCPIQKDGTGTMISYNHYASGAVGDFLYRRVCGIEPTAPGYQEFAICPIPGGGLTWANASHMTSYGQIHSHWILENGVFTLRVQIPVGTKCHITLPSGSQKTLGSGKYTLTEPI